jgi:hypothetical protein
VYVVTVYPESSSDYVAEFYAGLYDLQVAGVVDLRYGRRRAHGNRPINNRAILWLEVEVARASRLIKVCIDPADWHDIASIDDLAVADVYFKRSYRGTYVQQLPTDLRRKVVPLGLHYGCMSRNESLISCFKRALARHSNSGAIARTPIRTFAKLLASPTKLLLRRNGYAGFGNLPPFVDEFEVAPDVSARPMIFYRTRVYGPQDAPDTYRSGRSDEINGLRVATIRALRSHFGDRFIGGLRPSQFAEETYPDCMFPDDPGLLGHLALSKTCLINVNTAGLHDSTSWKMPEYLAGSRCIVSEPLTYEMPVPLRERKHYLAFRTPEECVRACNELLNDAQMASAMRKDNFLYYLENVRPAQLMLRSLETVVQHSCANATQSP